MAKEPHSVDCRPGRQHCRVAPSEQQNDGAQDLDGEAGPVTGVGRVVVEDGDQPHGRHGCITGAQRGKGHRRAHPQAVTAEADV